MAYNKQMLFAHASHGLRRQNACAFSRAKFGSYVNGATMRMSLIAIVFICFSSQLYAYCEGGKYPDVSIADEIKK